MKVELETNIFFFYSGHLILLANDFCIQIKDEEKDVRTSIRNECAIIRRPCCFIELIRDLDQICQTEYHKHACGAEDIDIVLPIVFLGRVGCVHGCC